MYPLGSLTAELQNATRKLIDVFESPDSKATQERRKQGMGKEVGSIGRLTQTKSSTGIPRSEAIVTAILEHGTIPAVALASWLLLPLTARVGKDTASQNLTTEEGRRRHSFRCPQQTR